MMIQHLIFIEQGDDDQKRRLHKKTRKKKHGKRNTEKETRKLMPKMTPRHQICAQHPAKKTEF